MPSEFQQPKLFTPIQVGDVTLQHRIVMAPLTRFRADTKHVPQPDIVAEYYAQRGSVPGTLLVSEATFIAQRAGGYPTAPGIWSAEQIAAWKKITTAVHEKGSFIYLQLWALGRAAVPAVLQGEYGRPCTGDDSPYVSSSAIGIHGRAPEAPVPRALTIAEVEEYVQLYAQAAENAVQHAGFDGVEIHGANGYLVDQFLQDVSNKRTDRYGGSIENRARFALEVLDAVVKRVGAHKTAIRLSPWSPYQGMGMEDPIPTFTYLVQQIYERHPDIAYLHVTGKREGDISELQGTDVAALDTFIPEGNENDFIRDLWSKKGKVLITAGGYTQGSAVRVAEATGNLIAFGRLFISNPDLPYRLKNKLPVYKGDRSSYYTPGAKGYTDYPFSPEFLEEKKKAEELARL